jgi:hypothetical protein
VYPPAGLPGAVAVRHADRSGAGLVHRRLRLVQDQRPGPGGEVRPPAA